MSGIRDDNDHRFVVQDESESTRSVVGRFELCGMMSEERVTVVLADDHPIVRNGIMHLINGSDEFAVVEEASDGLAAEKVILESKPPIAVLDVEMSKKNSSMRRWIADSLPTY